MTTETDFDDIYGSKYLSASDLHGEMPRRKIGKVEITELKEKDGSTKRKFVLFFIGDEKSLVLNKTNAQRLAQAYGKDRADWVGAGVELYAEMTSLGKEGVRLRPLKQQTADPISSGPARPSNGLNDAIPF